MTATASDRRPPAYQRIRNELRRRILDGELKPGDAVGSERDLAQRFGVSLMTARHALEELEHDGLVVRRSRVGTFVAPPRIQFNKLLSFTELMASRGFAAHSRLVSARCILDEMEISARLGLPGRSRLVRIERLRLANNRPLGLETCYLPAEPFVGLLGAGLERRSLFATLEQEYGIAIAYADEEVDATRADPRSAELLDLPPGAPLLRIRQVLFSSAATPVAYTVARYRSEQHSLLIRRFR